MRRIAYSREAAKTLKRIDGATRARIVAKIDQLGRAPEELAGNIRKLSGSSCFWLRIGDWRVIYADDLTVIAVIRIAARGRAYRGER